MPVSLEDRQAVQLANDFIKENYQRAKALDKGKSAGKVFDIWRNRIGNKVWPLAEKALKLGAIGVAGIGAILTPALLPVLAPFAAGTYLLGRYAKGHSLFMQNITLSNAAKFGSEMSKKGIPDAVKKKAIERFLKKESPLFTAGKYIRKNPQMIERLQNGLSVPKNNNFVSFFDRNTDKLAKMKKNPTFAERIDVYRKSFQQYKAAKAEEKAARLALSACTPTAGKTIAEAAADVSKKRLGEVLSATPKTIAPNITKAATNTAEKTVSETAKRLPLSKKLIEAIGSETLKKTGAKLATITTLKIGAKKIPILGAALGAVFATQRAFSGDWTGAGLELASGAASCVPGAGTVGSLAIDGALLARDMAGSR